MINTLKVIPIENIVPNNYNPRRKKNQNNINSMAQDIKISELINPLTVREIEDGKYEVIAGSTRYEALKLLGVKEVKCNIINADDDKAVLISLRENLRRTDLPPVDEARAFKEYIRKKIEAKIFKESNIHHGGLPPPVKKKLEKEFANICNMTRSDQEVKDLCKELNLVGQDVENKLHLLNLPDEILDAIDSKELDLREGIQISRLRQIIDKDIMREEMMKLFKKPRMWGSFSSLKLMVKNRLTYYDDIVEKTEKALKAKIAELEERIEEYNHDIIRLEKIVKNDLEAIYEELKQNNFKTKPILKIEDLPPLIEKVQKTYNDGDYYKRIQDIKYKIVEMEDINKKVKKDGVHTCPHCLSTINSDLVKSTFSKLTKDQESLEEERESLDNLLELMRKRDGSNRSYFRTIGLKREERKNYVKIMDDVKKELAEKYGQNKV